MALEVEDEQRGGALEVEGLAEPGKAVMLADSWSEGPPEDGRVKLEEVIEVTFSPEMEGEISLRVWDSISAWSVHALETAARL